LGRNRNNIKGEHGQVVIPPMLAGEDEDFDEFEEIEILRQSRRGD
jgi:hypothetical protein